MHQTILYRLLYNYSSFYFSDGSLIYIIYILRKRKGIKTLEDKPRKKKRENKKEKEKMRKRK
jgi:hypothetical protein